MRIVTKTLYTKEDCEALDNMSKREIINILNELEGSWMPSRPHEYYELMVGTKDEAEFDYELLRACKAIDLAIEMLHIAPLEEGESLL